MKHQFILSLSCLFIITSCGSNSTEYQSEKKDEGYSDSEKEGLKVSTFKANHYTKPSKARLYAEFRAIENCVNDGYKFANVLDIFDKSVSRKVTKTDSVGPAYYGSYGYGMYPFYSRYSGMGVGVGIGTSSSRSWDETYVYPNIEVPYTCANSIHRPKIMFREVPAEEMKHLVKDIKGGVQIQKFLDDSPNEKRLAINDIILRANGVRVERVYEIVKLFDEDHSAIKVDLLRDGVKKSFVMKAVDVSDVAGKAEEKIIKEACKEEQIQKKFKKTLCKR